MGAMASGAENLPLTERQAAAVDGALSGLDSRQLTWVSGYAAGMASMPLMNASSASAPAQTFTILYGSQTGNGERIATRLAGDASAMGFAVRLESLADFKPSHLKKETLASFIISTHGEGDPPDDAELFHEFLLSAKAPRLGHLNFSVLALGDSSYVNFCQTGREFDQRLAELGATRLAPVAECDVDYAAAADAWAKETLERLPGLLQSGRSAPTLRAVPSDAGRTENGPVPAEVLVNQRITGRDSTKVVHHIELSLAESALSYEPGDALAIMPVNPPRLVARIIDTLGIDASSPVTVDGEAMRIDEALSKHLEITSLNLGFLRRWTGICGSEDLAVLLDDENRQKLTDFIESRQVVDVIREHPAMIDAQTLADTLRKLTTRSYSIASSLAANPDEVHLTVAAVSYDAFGSEHWGAASTFLSDRLAEGDTVGVTVEPNSRFRLPADPAVPIIMIGPGTGVAPFRAFIEERAEQAAPGRSWLFFGERNIASDFLYQLEWQRHLERGTLTRLDVAFSRDQEEKCYVQDRIRERGAELVDWLDDGAHIYVCGDAKRMAPDVHEALVDVLVRHAAVDRDTAESTIRDWRRNGRYLRDIY